MENKIRELLSIKKSNNLTLREISSYLEETEELLLEVIEKLEKQGIIYKNKSDKYMLVSSTNLVKGIVKITKRKGPIVVCEGKDLLLSHKDHHKVMNNDVVLIEPFNKSGSASLIKVLERNYKDIVGEVIKDGKKYYIEMPDMERIYLKESYPIGTRVLLDGKDYRIKEVIGHKNDPDTLVKEVLSTNKFPISYSNEYLKELENIPSTLIDDMLYEELSKGRYDLRDLNLVTIDGIDTKDFDDSVGYQDGMLYISIADLTSVIKEDSVIEKDAINRGTSVYPPGMVNPMFHHNISDGICSLVPFEDRLTISFIAKVSESGEVTSFKFAPSIIKSKMRMTYEDVNLFLEDNIVVPEYKDKTDMIERLYNIAMKMKNKMLNEGFLEFTSEEVKFIFEHDLVVDFKKRHHGKAEELIEFLMLLYNISFTNYFIEHKLPFIARNHDKPNNEKVNNWHKLLKQRGYKVDSKKEYTSDDIKKSLSTYKGEDEQVVLDYVAIRSQSKARYGAVNMGHYALGLKAYGTGTSPIRRLSDYINERVYIDSITYGDKYARSKWEPRMEMLADACTNSEKRADKVERLMDDIKKAEVMAKKIGSKYTGIVSEVGCGYIKVLLPNMVSGKVMISGREYELSRDHFSLHSKKTTEKILVGDSINVQVSKVDTNTGDIYFLRQDIKYKECSYEEKEKKGKKKIKSR